MVHFIDENDASTAQLLSDSLLVDRPVTITPVPKDGPALRAAPASKPVEAKPVQQKKPQEKEPEKRKEQAEETKKSAGDGAAVEEGGKADQEQAQSGILDSVMQRASELKAKVEEEGGVRESVTRRLSKLNEEHHFTDKLAEVRAKTSAAATQVMASDSVQRGLRSLWSGISQLKDAAIKAEAANREFNAKLLREAKGRQSPRGRVAETAEEEGAAPNLWQAPDADGENAEANTAKSSEGGQANGEEGGKGREGGEGAAEAAEAGREGAGEKKRK